MKSYSPKIPTQDVLNHFGSQVNIAKALSISTSTVNEWGEYVNEINSYRLVHLFPKPFKKFLPRVGKNRQVTQ